MSSLFSDDVIYKPAPGERLLDAMLDQDEMTAELIRAAVSGLLEIAIEIGVMTPEGVIKLRDEVKRRNKKILLDHVATHEAKGEESCISREEIEEMFSDV